MKNLPTAGRHQGRGRVNACKMKATYLLFLFIISACSKEGGEDKSSRKNINYYENYLTETKEAPIYFYCKIDHLLDSETRALICNHVHTKSKYIPIELSFTIRDKKVEDIGIWTVHVNSENLIELYEPGYPSLENKLRMLTYSDIVYTELNDGSYTTRIQLEKFCYNPSVDKVP